MVHPSTPDPDMQPQPTCAICLRRIRWTGRQWAHLEAADHPAAAPLTVAGTLYLEAGPLAERIAELVLAGLQDQTWGSGASPRLAGLKPSAPIGAQGFDQRHGETFDQSEFPPRGTVRFGDVVE